MADSVDQKAKILIVDDEPAVRDLLAQMLSDGYECITSESAEAALDEIAKTKFDLVISDVNLGGMTGVEMVPLVQKDSPDTVVMVISGAGSVDTAIGALRAGVFDYIRKPFNCDDVMSSVAKAIEHRRSLVAKRRLDAELSTLVEQKRAELDHLVHHDALTDLPNESMFERRLREQIKAAGADHEIAILIVGISNLRGIRDSLGQVPANRIVLDIAERLRRTSDERMVARLEGDRFAMLIASDKLDDVVGVVREIVAVLATPFVVDEREIHVHVNVGISVFPADGKHPHDLIRNAGAALSEAEASGVGRSVFFAPAMNAQAIKRLTLETHLHRALERNELAVFYQPKIAVQSGNIIGMEALLRWTSPELGSVSPEVFIPIAESADLIGPIGEWVLRTACAQTRSWHDQGYALHLAVNLSARQLTDPNLANKIWSILEETGLDPHRLNLEVTESSIVTDPPRAIKILGQLQKLGVSISVDDFGTGHSSFGYLRTLPIDVLKIDKSFVRNITTDADAATLVKTMITLAHDLRLSVVAEGVETEEHLNVLERMECDEWQGFLHSRPMSLSDFDAKLRSQWKMDDSQRVTT